jgi:hypothetical protein
MVTTTSYANKSKRSLGNSKLGTPSFAIYGVQDTQISSQQLGQFIKIRLQIPSSNYCKMLITMFLI